MSRNDTDWSFNLQLLLFHYLNLVQMSPKLLTCSLRFSHFYIYFLAICLLIQPVVTVFFYLCLFFLFSFLSSGFVGSFLHFSLFSFSSFFFFSTSFFLSCATRRGLQKFLVRDGKQTVIFFFSFHFPYDFAFPFLCFFLSFFAMQSLLSIFVLFFSSLFPDWFFDRSVFPRERAMKMKKVMREKRHKHEWLFNSSTWVKGGIGYCRLFKLSVSLSFSMSFLYIFFISTCFISTLRLKSSIF